MNHLSSNVEHIMLFMPDGYDRDDLLIDGDFVEDPKFSNFQFPACNRIVAQAATCVTSSAQTIVSKHAVTWRRFK
jgi:hypothetical protein